MTDHAAVQALAGERVEDATASALAAHFERLADVTAAADPTTFLDEGLRAAATRLAGAIGDQLLAGHHIRHGPRA